MSSQDRQACFICSAVANQPHQPFDRPLIREEGVGVVIGAVGPFCPGYVIVSPELHLPASTHLPTQTATRFAGLVATVRSEIESLFGPSVLFEHGGCGSGERAGSACVDHAHIHLHPCPDPLGLPAEGDVFRDLRSFLCQGRDLYPDGYLMLQAHGDLVRIWPDPGVSQFFRRRLAPMFGRPDEWDYAAFPRIELLSETMARLGGQSS